MGNHGDTFTETTVSWAINRAVDDITLVQSILHWDLGAGESQVLSYCLVNQSVAVLDDGAARACAQAHEIPVIGTLGIIIRSRKKGLIVAARPLVKLLLEAGSRLNRELVETALMQVGE